MYVGLPEQKILIVCMPLQLPETSAAPEGQTVLESLLRMIIESNDVSL